MASARQKKDKWYYRITITTPDGSHKYVERGGFSTKEEALKEGKKAELQIKEKNHSSKNDKIMSFNFLQKEWLSHSDSLYKPKTIQSYKEVMRISIVPIIGTYEISSITPPICQKVIDTAVEKRYSYNRIAMIKNALNGCFKYGIKMGYLNSSPTKYLTLPKKRSIAGARLPKQKEIRALTKEEIDFIFRRFPEGHQYFILNTLAYRCGLRIGEAMAVTIDDIDFKGKKLHVRRQLQKDDKTNRYYFTALKHCNPGEERVIDLDDDTLQILKRHVEKILSLGEKMYFPIYKEDENGFLNTETGKEMSLIDIRLSDGKLVDKSSVITMVRAIKGYRIKSPVFTITDFNFHMLRHTHASECIAAGMSPVTVQKRLGHKNLSTTYNYYVHETEPEVTGSRDILEKMFRS